MKYLFNSLVVLFLLLSCNKETAELAKPLPSVDTFSTPKNIFFTAPVRIINQNSVRIEVLQSNPCHPSHEVFFFYSHNSNYYRQC